MRCAIMLLLSVLAGIAANGDDWPYPSLTGDRPLVIAHRGASGYLPEHTLEAYALAIDLGADFIEPDLVLTKDGHLVARHDDYLSTTTDVAERLAFAKRKRTRHGRTDWFVDDFTLAELKRLRARQAFPKRNQSFDGRFEIPTFDEVVALVRKKSIEQGRAIGIYPETKKPSQFAEAGLDFVPPLVAALQRHGLNTADAPVFVQSFEPEILLRLSDRLAVPLVLLVYPDQAGRPNLAMEDYAGVIAGVGPHKGLLLDAQGQDSGFVARAHALGLQVHPWTHRADQLPPGLPDTRSELEALYRLGVDGVFSDFPDIAQSVRAVMQAQAGAR